MSDFAPPSGPPPPKVPEGWKAVWNDQYKEWFYVNLHTKQSQWDKPEHPAADPNAHSHDAAAPPSYASGPNAPAGAGTDLKSPNLYSNNPYGQNTADSDEAYARRLQEEENRRSGDRNRGASDSYYGGSNQGYPSAPDYSQQQPHQQQQQQQQYGGVQSSADRGSGKSGGFLNKIKEKMSQPGGQRPMGAPMMGYNAGGYPPQHYNNYNNYPPQGQYGGYPQQGYGGRPMMGGYGQPVKKKGMGAGGAAALGVGGGLLGGMLIADGINDMQEDSYDQGFDDGGDMGGDMGGDF